MGTADAVTAAVLPAATLSYGGTAECGDGSGFPYNYSSSDNENVLLPMSGGGAAKGGDDLLGLLTIPDDGYDLGELPGLHGPVTDAGRASAGAAGAGQLGG